LNQDSGLENEHKNTKQEEESSRNLQNQEGEPNVEELVKEMLPVPKKKDVSLDRNSMDLQFGSQLFSPSRNVETAMWVVAKRRKYIYCSE
jgi:hypothetical protein